MARPPLLVVLALLVAGLLPPLAASARPGEPRQTLPGATHGDRIPAAADRALRRSLAKLRRGTARAAAVGDSGLQAGAWCGAEQATDDTAHQAHTGPRIKVIYAYPADRPNRFAAMRDLIQADARDMTELLLAASGGRRTLRFDVGTRCGAGYVDILAVRLPRGAAAYRQLDPSGRMTQLRGDLAPAVAKMSGKRNYLVYADDTMANDGVAGIGSVYLDDRPGAENAANSGNLWAMAFGDGDEPGFLPSRLTTVLHEVSHNLGAVQDSAPHATQAGHCTDEADVMCYDDGGPSSVLTFPCAQEAYDCGGDDYFNAAPAGGSYLDTHWNLYDSVFLCPAGSCVGASVGGGNPAPSAAIALRDEAGRGLATVTAGVPVVLDGSASSDDEGVSEYAWDIGADGTVEGRDARHRTVLATPGEVAVRLTVRDAYGATGTTVAIVRVTAPVFAPPPRPATPAPARTPRRDPAVAALRASLGSLRGALRDAQASGRLGLRFTPPRAGRLTATVTLGRRTLAERSWKVRAGQRRRLTVPLAATARHRLARGGAVRVRLTFQPASGMRTSATQTVALARR